MENRFENKAHCNMSENCSMIQQAVKDTAKEILRLIKSSEYVDSLKTISIWAVEKIFKERYGVEVE